MNARGILFEGVPPGPVREDMGTPRQGQGCPMERTGGTPSYEQNDRCKSNNKNNVQLMSNQIEHT